MGTGPQRCGVNSYVNRDTSPIECESRSELNRPFISLCKGLIIQVRSRTDPYHDLLQISDVLRLNTSFDLVENLCKECARFEINLIFIFGLSYGVVNFR